MVVFTKSGGAFAVLAFAPELKLYQTTYQEPLVLVPRANYRPVAFARDDVRKTVCGPAARPPAPPVRWLEDGGLSDDFRSISQ